MLYFIAFLLPVFIAAISIPFVLGIVPPNRWYGFRTPKTRSSPTVWYPANRVAGWCVIAAMAAVICFNAVLWASHPEWPAERLIQWMATATVLSVVIALIASLLYLRRL